MIQQRIPRVGDNYFDVDLTRVMVKSIFQDDGTKVVYKRASSSGGAYKILSLRDFNTRFTLITQPRKK